MKKGKRTYYRITATLLSVIMIAGILFGVTPVNVLAQTDITSGVDWTLDDYGMLTILSDAGMEDWTDNGSSTYKEDVYEITILSGVTKISANAFAGCEMMDTAILPDTVQSIGENAFANCEYLEKIQIPESVTNIGDNAFKLSGLMMVTIPAGVKEMGNGVFSGCSELMSVMMKSSAPPTIGSGVFEDCKFVTDQTQSIYVPDGSGETYKAAWTDLVNYIVEGEAYITSGVDWTLDISGMLTIRSDAGMEDWSDNGRSRYKHDVNKINILNGVTEISRNAFTECAVTEVNIADSVQTIGKTAFTNCRSLRKIRIPEGVTSLEYFVFGMCSSLTEIEIPESVISIGNEAFDRSGLTEIIIPAGVQSIGDTAFSGCDSLASVTMKGTTPPAIGSGVFEDCKFVTDQTQSIHVPDGKAADYKGAWTDWADYIADDPVRHTHDDGTEYEALGTSGTLSGTGMYFLTEDVIMDLNITGSIALCLNGHTLTGAIEIKNGGSLKLLDCGQGGLVTNSYTARSVITNYGHLEIFGGAISGTTYGLELAGEAVLSGNRMTISGNTADIAFHENGLLTVNDYTGGVLTIDAENSKIVKDSIIIQGVSAGNRDKFTTADGSTYTLLLDGTDIRKHMHSWNDGDITKEPSCTTTGVKTYQCTVCNETKTEEIPELGHLFGTEWSADETNHWHECRCGDKKDTAAHVYDNDSDMFCNICNYDRTFFGKQPPTGTIKIDTNTWSDFLNTVTFERFFKETKSVTIEAKDENSGVDKIYYYISDKALSKAEVTSLSEGVWTEGSSFLISPDKRCVIYAKITNKEGNTAYISSDGLVFDSTNPVISGVTDGKTYRAPQTVTVTDDNIKSVKVNGREVTLNDGKFILEAASGEQTIVVTDKAGNTVTVKVIVKTEKENTEDAKKVVEHVLADYTAANTDTKQDIQKKIDEAVRKAEITDVTVTVGELTKTEATENIAGSITGSVTIVCGSETDSVAINKTIPATAAGKIDKDVQTDGKAPATQIFTSLKELEDMLLTDEEKQQAADGTDIKMVLDVKDAQESVDSEDKNKVEAALDGCTMGQYLDISLYKLIGENRTDITKTDKTIVITIAIPENLRNTDRNVTRAFRIIRVHDGEVQLLSDMDDSAETITIATDRFSTYAIVYKDTVIGGNNGGNDNAADEEDYDDEEDADLNQSQNISPNTGDSTPLRWYAVCVIISGVLCLFLYMRERRKKAAV